MTEQSNRFSRRALVQRALALSAVAAVLANRVGAAEPPDQISAKRNNNAVKQPQANYRVALMLFDNMTQLDATAPLEVFSSASGFSVDTVASTSAPITTGCGLKVLADHTYDSLPQADILCIPGGPGVNPLLTDDETIAFIQRVAGDARYVTSVCTGALLLGAAGLLNGRKATTHWASMHFLEALGCTPVHERVVIDGNLITGGGVTAGIDFAFSVIDELAGRDTAALTMLALEYNPAPPFPGGSVAKTDPSLVNRYNALAAQPLEFRGQQVERAAQRMRAEERHGGASVLNTHQ